MNDLQIKTPETGSYHIVYFVDETKLLTKGKTYYANDMIDALTMFDLDDETPEIGNVAVCHPHNITILKR